MIKSIIFDLDQTLYDYNYLDSMCYDVIINDINKKTGKKELEIKEIIKEAKIKVKNNLKNTASSHSRILYFQKICEILDINLSYAQTLNNIYWDIFYETIKPYDFIITLFDYLKKQKIKIAILTNFTTEHQFKKLSKLKLLKYVDCLVTSEEVGIEKPDKKMFETILNKLNMKSNEVLMIGDSFKSDIEGANNYNIYAGHYTDLNLINKNYFTFSSMQNLYLLILRMNIEINKLVNMCKIYGERFDFTQAGGGNISVKFNFDKEIITIIKASGYCLSDVSNNNGYTIINNNKINEYVNNLIMNEDKNIIENKTKNFIKSQILFNCKLRPSIETPMHSLFYKYTVHLHPIQCNIILTKKNGKEIIKNLFPNSLIIDYYTPGIELSKNIQLKYSGEKIIFLLNHGLIVTSNSSEEIDSLIKEIINIVEEYINNNMNLQINFDKYKVVNKMSLIYESVYKSKFTSYLVEDEIVKKNIDNLKILNNVSIPDKLVYCGNNIINLSKIGDLKNILKDYNHIPVIIKFNNNLYIISKSLKKCKDIVDVLKSHLLFSSDNDNLLDIQEIDYLINWEAEKYRQNL
jgi:HAD superfamily hydrolase (TIGR01549 family)